MDRQHESEPSLIEQLFESSVADLCHVNISAQREASRMLAEKNPNAFEYTDLKLVPDFMISKDGGLMVGVADQRRVAESVLNELHSEWNGSEATEYQVSEKYTENYWEFVDAEFTPWTVVEMHNNQPEYHEKALSAYILCGPRRPATYQKLLNEKEQSQLELEDASGSGSSSVEQPDKRTQKAAKSIGKWLKKQTQHPPRPNRFE